jgi:ABC-type nitrate/sulfonate/bicarbonate transport system substrate-binding protein
MDKFTPTTNSDHCTKHGARIDSLLDRNGLLIYFIILIALSLGLSAACKRSQPKSDSGPLRIGLLQHSSSIPLIVAQQHGFFQKRGLQVELVNVSADQHMPSLMTYAKSYER